MKPSLTLVPSPAGLAPQSSTSQALHGAYSHRKLFWSAFITWLATATDEESEQLERALAPHAHHVRPLADAVSDAINDAARSSKTQRSHGQHESATALPHTLLAELFAAGWRPLLATQTRLESIAQLA
jgi:hypothetical protein